MEREKSKIRFAIGLLDFSRRKGGAERYLVDLCIRMVEEGHDVHVYSERWDEGDSRIHFHRIQTVPFPKSLRLFYFALQSTKAMHHEKYDITFGVGNTLRANILQPHGGVHWAWFWRSLRAYDHPALWALKFVGRIVSLKQWVNGWIENAPYRGEDPLWIIAISDMVKQDMIRWYHIPEDRIAVVYNGIDIEKFHPKNRQYRDEIRRRYGVEEEFLILFVSNNFRMKGLGYLMKALAIMKKEGQASIKLLIIGRDRQDPYRRLAHKIGISQNMIFVGSTNEIEKYYGAADLLVHPSFYDACSLTVLEAMASGLPVITTFSNGVSGIITQGQEGFVLSDPRDSQILIQHILLYLNPGVRRQASMAARRLAEDHSQERNWKEIKSVFDRAMLKGKPLL